MKTAAGFPHKDVSWLQGLIVVRSPLAKVQALAGKKGRGTQGWEIAGPDQPYTALWWEKCEPDLAKKLSAKLKTTVSYVWDEDTSGWFGYSVFENGKEVEALQYGMNYDAEFADLAEEMGDALPDQKKSKDKWDLALTKDGDDFLFRSKVAKATEKEIVKGLKFVDARFKALGIPAPKDFPKMQVAMMFAEK